MRLLADESVDFGIVRELRQRGFEVLAIVELFPSIPDTQVLQLAVEREALLLTEDKDFGELIIGCDFRTAAFYYCGFWN